jgi:5-hydroxyisourate hydrolase
MLNLFRVAIRSLSPGEGPRIAASGMLREANIGSDAAHSADGLHLEMGITLRILDGTYGLAAADVPARLERAGTRGWVLAGSAETGSDGRIADLCDERLDCGLYRLALDSGRYFASLGVSGAYPEVIIVFRVRDESGNCVISISLSPYSYSAHLFTSTSVE